MGPSEVDFTASPHYIPGLQRLAEQQPKTTPQQALEACNRVIKIIPGGGSYERAIFSALRELAQLNPGRACLERLTEALGNKVLTICDSTTRDEAMAEFVPATNILFISPEIKNYFVAMGVVHPLPFSTTFVHELLHVLHFHEDATATFRNLNSNAFHPALSNLEEQLTITGLKENNGPVELCENVFHYIQNIPLRPSHRHGLLIRDVALEALGLDHLIFAHATQSAKMMVLSKPHTVHQTYCLDWMEGIFPSKENPLASKKLFPLSFAIDRNQDDLTEFLLTQGARVDCVDDFGGPIPAACMNHRYQLAIRLVEWAVEKGHPLDLGNLLESLVTGWRTCKYSDSEDFYALLGRIHTLIGSDANNFSPLLDQLRSEPIARAGNIFSWMLEHQVGITGVDRDGNTLLMIMLKLLPRNTTLLPRSSHFKKLVRLIAHPQLHPFHKNKSGETLHSIAKSIDSETVLQQIEEALGKRSLAL